MINQKKRPRTKRNPNGAMNKKIKVKESDLQNSIFEYLALLPGCFCWRNNSVGVFDSTRKVYIKNNSKYAINGTADILGIYLGRPLAIEVKGTGGVLSDNQILFLDNFENAGGIAIAAWSLEDVIEKLKI